MRRFRAIALLLLLGAASACATGSGPSEVGEADPLRPVNRGVFGFNEGLDWVLFQPLALGWIFISPEGVRVRLGKFFDNLEFPVRFVNNLLQGAVKQSGREVGRFVVNTTVGFLGFFDPATGWGLTKQDEDFGQTLGWWGVGSGAYLVLPILGPSSVRDGIGRVPDALLQPGSWFLLPIQLINLRALLHNDIQELRSASLDYYVSVRNVYLQYRRAAVANGELPDEEDDLYEVMDDEE